MNFKGLLSIYLRFYEWIYNTTTSDPSIQEANYVLKGSNTKQASTSTFFSSSIPHHSLLLSRRNYSSSYTSLWESIKESYPRNYTEILEWIERARSRDILCGKTYTEEYLPPTEYEAKMPKNQLVSQLLFAYNEHATPIVRARLIQEGKLEKEAPEYWTSDSILEWLRQNIPRDEFIIDYLYEDGEVVPYEYDSERDPWDFADFGPGDALLPEGRGVSGLKFIGENDTCVLIDLVLLDEEDEDAHPEMYGYDEDDINEAFQEYVYPKLEESILRIDNTSRSNKTRGIKLPEGMHILSMIDLFIEDGTPMLLFLMTDVDLETLESYERGYTTQEVEDWVERYGFKTGDILYQIYVVRFTESATYPEDSPSHPEDPEDSPPKLCSAEESQKNKMKTIHDWVESTVHGGNYPKWPFKYLPSRFNRDPLHLEEFPPKLCSAKESQKNKIKSCLLVFLLVKNLTLTYSLGGAPQERTVRGMHPTEMADEITRIILRRLRYENSDRLTIITDTYNADSNIRSHDHRFWVYHHRDWEAIPINRYGQLPWSEDHPFIDDAKSIVNTYYFGADPEFARLYEIVLFHISHHSEKLTQYRSQGKLPFWRPWYTLDGFKVHTHNARMNDVLLYYHANDGFLYGAGTLLTLIAFLLSYKLWRDSTKESRTSDGKNLSIGIGTLLLSLLALYILYSLDLSLPRIESIPDKYEFPPKK